MAFALLAAFCAAGAHAAPAKKAMPHHHELNALYVIDHRGANPSSDAVLADYSAAFHRILRSCQINAEVLTNSMLWVAYKASDQGQRRVSSLMAMQAVARRITWTHRAACWRIFDTAEGHLEAGDP